jgi:hypothetical protein
MLRRPGDYPAVQLGEGCSSNAIGAASASCGTTWNNLADRGFVPQLALAAPALP